MTQLHLLSFVSRPPRTRELKQYRLLTKMSKSGRVPRGRVS